MNEQITGLPSLIKHAYCAVKTITHQTWYINSRFSFWIENWLKWGFRLDICIKMQFTVFTSWSAHLLGFTITLMMSCWAALIPDVKFHFTFPLQQQSISTGSALLLRHYRTWQQDDCVLKQEGWIWSPSIFNHTHLLASLLQLDYDTRNIRGFSGSHLSNESQVWWAKKRKDLLLYSFIM